jgi:hypothetical protein
MKISLKITQQSAFCLLVLLLNEFLTSCTPPIYRALPPENYKGPMAKQPVLQQGDYWIQEKKDKQVQILLQAEAEAQLAGKTLNELPQQENELTGVIRQLENSQSAASKPEVKK